MSHTIRDPTGEELGSPGIVIDMLGMTAVRVDPVSASIVIRVPSGSGSWTASVAVCSATDNLAGSTQP